MASFIGITEISNIILEKTHFGAEQGLASKGRILNIAPSLRLLYDEDIAAYEQRVFRTRIIALR